MIQPIAFPAGILVAIQRAEILAFPSAALIAGGAPPGSPPPPDDSGSPPADDGLDGIVGRLNSEFALVLLGSRAVIMREMLDAPIEDRTRVISIEAFRAYFVNKGSMIKRRRRTSDGDWEEVSVYVKWAPQWLAVNSL